MTTKAPDSRLATNSVAWLPTLLLALAMQMPARAHAQASEDDLQRLRLESTPIGALPPLALPMPASRNHNYWGARLQAGYRRERRGPNDLLAVAGGVDYQARGGSTFGLTAGFQDRDCELAGEVCGRHSLFGARSRISLITGGSAVGGIFGDYSATNSFGTEFGIGYAPDVVAGMNACTVDFGIPYSIALFQSVRVVSFVTPGVVWDVDCSSNNSKTGASYMTSFGVGLQQIGPRELDVYLGVQRIFRGNSGYQIGLTVTYTKLH